MARDWWEDPDCPPLPDPPAVPKTSQLTCHVFHSGNWHRRILYLNAGNVPGWQPMALRVNITARIDTSDVWVQFYRTDPNNPAQVVGTPYDFYATFIPATAVLSIDGMRNTIQMKRGGLPGGAGTVDASHLVFRSRTGHVFRWPDIDCGGVWQMIVRWPKTAPTDAIQVTSHAAVKYA